jgi:hypothetical protein
MAFSFKYLGVRIAVILLALITGYVIYGLIVKPAILDPLCLTDTGSCVRMAFYRYNNSALVHMRNTGIWLWFNGHKAYVYGQPVGQLCKDPNSFEAAYAINTRTGLKEGYECVTVLGELINFYKTKTDMEYLYKRVKDRNNFDVYAALNMLQDLDVIDMGTSDKK